MHASYFNDPRIRDAWQKQAIRNLDVVSVRDKHIAAGLLIPAKTA